MKYRLKRDLPWHKAGTELGESDLNKIFLISVYDVMEKYPDWIEPVSERIELHRIAEHTEDAIRRKDMQMFSVEQIKKMEAALNGECWTEEEIKAAFLEWYPHPLNITADTSKHHLMVFMEFLKKQK